MVRQHRRAQRGQRIDHAPRSGAADVGRFAFEKRAGGDGYVVESLEAALWAFAKSRSFEHGALLAVNLGDDADTTGAVYGQIAGAYYGAGAIPERWRSKLAHRETLESFAERLYEGAVPKWKRLARL
jgi:ADP-ribosyl-[dinitrogen reductase] hydrolase